MINNSNLETLILNPREVLGILDLRSLWYYKIKQGVIQQKLSRFYEFESADEVVYTVQQFNQYFEEGTKVRHRGKIPMAR